MEKNYFGYCVNFLLSIIMIIIIIIKIIYFSHLYLIRQMNFLVAALEAAVANRAMVPWIVVTLHKPPYCSAEGTPTGYAAKVRPHIYTTD